MRDEELEKQLALKIGEAARKARINAKLSQSALSEKCGIAVPHISRLERGVRLPTLGTLLRVSSALNTTVAKLVSL